MSTIVVHKETGRHYLLIGTGYSFFKDSRPNFFGGVLFPHEDEGEAMCAAICDEKGAITWVQTSEIEVIEVNGVKVKEILSPYTNEIIISETEICPACEARISITAEHCPECGIRLVD